MQAAMRPLIELSGPERDLLIELLERERGDLPPEIRHTDTPEMKDRLRERLEIVERVLNRMKQPA
jgi:hypothetical protein